MSRRDRVDPETTRVVEQRLQWLLRENGPGTAPLAPDPDPPVDHDHPADPPRRGRRPRSVGDNQEKADPPVRPVTREPGLLLASLTSFRRPHLVIVAVIVAAGILLAGWAVLRARPAAVAVTPPPVAASRPASVAPSGPAGAGTPTAEVIVHVLGAVKKPGLVTLPGGSRVQDALDAAGGLTGKADPGELNLAQAVTDGQQILVGTKGKPSGEVRDGASGGGGGTSGSGDGSSGGANQTVNLNSATQAQLEGLPGVGPVMAGKIMAWRTENGRFSRVEELQEIDGVGPKTYAKLAPLCTV